MSARRRLAAILAADVAGYSRLMGEDEEGTVLQLRAYRAALRPIVAEHGGRIVDMVGDGMLLELPSVVAAVACAMAMQVLSAERNADLPPERRLLYRIGINFCDVLVEGKSIFGDGVNIAARLQSMADPGGICLSRAAYEEVRGKVAMSVQDLGEQQLRHIADPVRAYAIAPAAGVPPAAALPPPGRASIAVLPFDTMSNDREEAYFADGLVEEIITNLSCNPWLMVIARNSSFTYRGRAVDIKQVGRELSVRYVLEGSVRRSATRLRITGQLIDAATGVHLWADRFEGPLEDIFDLQDQLTAGVVGGILPELEWAEYRRVLRKPPASLDAYDLFLRGAARIHELGRDNHRELLGFFYKAIELDRSFAPTYGLASSLFIFRKSQGWFEDPEREIEEGISLARRAVEFAHGDPLALGLGAFALSFLGRESQLAATLVDQALALNPNFLVGWVASGFIRTALGESDRAIEHLNRAKRLSPRDPRLYLMHIGVANAHIVAQRYEAAAIEAAQAFALQPASLAAARAKAAALGLLGRDEEARAVVRQMLADDPKLRLSTAHLRFPHLRPEDMARFIEGLRRAGTPE
jgi:TolB-like protein/class 3 adenylate cyclase